MTIKSNATVRMFVGAQWVGLLSICWLFHIGTAMAESPPPLPVPTLEEAIRYSNIIVAEGVRVHWLIGGQAPSMAMREIPGPTSPGSHAGPIVLEAKVLDLIDCKTPCSKNTTVFILLDAYTSRVNEVNKFIGKPLIYLVQDAFPWKPAGLSENSTPPWNVKLFNTYSYDSHSETANALPINDRPAVEAIIEKNRASKGKPNS
jgi:hypothetical protein